MRRILTLWAGAAAALVVAWAIAAAQTSPQTNPQAGSQPNPQANEEMANIIKYRQELMKTNAGHARDIGMILRGDVPFDARHIREHAEAILAMSKLIIQCFPKGSGQAAGQTRAKDEIWTQWDKFMAAAVTLQKETEKLIEVTRTGNMSEITTQMVIVGKNSCGDCHETFRKGE